MNSLTDRNAHFRFGENWQAYAEKIDDAAIAEACTSLQRLAGEPIQGKRVLDIGCGSGLHALAFLRSGAASVLGIDIDSDSVSAAQMVLSRYAPNFPWHIEEKSIFDLSSVSSGSFDIVYSWGVLHHTGDMARAMRSASEFVVPGGLFIFALYRKTWLCPFWKREKHWYTHASPSQQKVARRVYTLLFHLGLWATGRQFNAYVSNYKTNRGMDFYHDVHDWLGGWPYESISPIEIGQLMLKLGFEHVRSFLATERRLFSRHLGVFGSGCDEYVYKRQI